MGVRNFGVWAAKPISYKAEFNRDDTRSPHITLRFDDGSGGAIESAAINVKSISEESRLVCWTNNDFQHPIIDNLRSLEYGFHFVPDRTGVNEHLKLDYQRADPPLLQFSDGLILPHDIPGENNDVLDMVLPIIKRAIDQDTTVYVFGSSYRTGIHDVHMNQGSLPRFDNGVGQDGGLIFHFKEDNHFEAVFLAFASQRVPTDDETGLAFDDSPSLADLVEGGAVQERSRRQD